MNIVAKQRCSDADIIGGAACIDTNTRDVIVFVREKKTQQFRLETNLFFAQLHFYWHSF